MLQQASLIWATLSQDVKCSTAANKSSEISALRMSFWMKFHQCNLTLVGLNMECTVAEGVADFSQESFESSVTLKISVLAGISTSSCLVQCSTSCKIVLSLIYLHTLRNFSHSATLVLTPKMRFCWGSNIVAWTVARSSMGGGFGYVILHLVENPIREGRY